MGKISLISSKYIVHAEIQIEGVVDKPDIIGAIFGQTEGLLGEELELRELQRSGRIGRIEVNTENRGGKTAGSIVVPSSLDKAETAIVAAALEIIERIGPCNAKVKVRNIQDVRITKRQFVIARAKELLKALQEDVLPDSQELSDEVTQSVRTMEIVAYGRERLEAGPGIDESDEIIVVEGRADVLNLLKHGFKNVIAINGTSVPQTIVDLSKKKSVTLFVDGDRGGDLIIKEMLTVAEVDFVTKAPDGKEVEELAKKEIHKALRSRVTAEQAKLDLPRTDEGIRRDRERPRHLRPQRDMRRGGERERWEQAERQGPAPERETLSPHEREVFKQISENLIGTRGAYLLDDKLNVLGKVPITELQTTLENANNVYAIVFDGVIEREFVQTAERAKVRRLVGMDNKVRPHEARMVLATINDL